MLQPPIVAPLQLPRRLMALGGPARLILKLLLPVLEKATSLAVPRRRLASEADNLEAGDVGHLGTVG